MRQTRSFNVLVIASFGVLLVIAVTQHKWWSVGIATVWIAGAVLDILGKAPRWSLHPTADASKSGIQRWRERRSAQKT